MSVDWITVAAQIINFLVLIWLLKRFLYKPILDGIDAREADIAARVAAADTARKNAEAEAAALRTDKDALAHDRAALIDAARAEAEATSARLVADAQAAAEEERAEWTAQMARARVAFAADLHDAGAEALTALTRKALRDLADEDLEDRIARHLAAGLGDLDDDLRAAAGRATGVAAQSSAPLGPDARAVLTAAVEAAMPGLALTFETDPAQSPGVVLRFGGGQVAWTLDAYLNRVDAELESRLTPGRHARQRAAQ